MQILIKALHGKQFTIDLDPEKTVQDLKEEIQKEEGPDCKVECQKLIYDGKILLNSNKLSEYNINPKKFVVLLLTRPQPPPKVAESQTILKKEETTKKDDSSSSSNQNPRDRSSSATPVASSGSSATVAPSTTTTTGAPSAAATTTTTTTTLATPANASSTTTTTTTNTNPRSTGQAQNLLGLSRLPGLSSSEMAVEATMASRLNQLMTHPHFANLQTTLHQNPHLLSSAIESLSTADPDMYQFVSDNPDIFLSALNATPPSALGRHRDRPRRSEVAPRGQAMISSGGGLGAEQAIMDHMLPSATDQDRQAIERLKELGFSEYQAVQAYVVCDKDEQLAANFLFSMDQ